MSHQSDYSLLDISKDSYGGNIPKSSPTEFQSELQWKLLFPSYRIRSIFPFIQFVAT